MFPHEVSGGMAQRVALALALAGEPALIIADEPTTSLDVTVQAEILDLLHDLVSDGAAPVIVTHDLGALADICDEGLVMHAGEVVERGPVAELTTCPKHPVHRRTASCEPARCRTRRGSTEHPRSCSPGDRGTGWVPPPSIDSVELVDS